MEKIDIIRALVNRQPGASLSVVVNRPAKVYKEHSGVDIRKRSRFNLQLASYANRKPVREAVEAGEREAPELPRWVSHSENIGNGLRFWVGKDGQQYLAMPRFGSKSESDWLLNGRPVKETAEKNFVLSCLQASEKRQRETKEETEAKGQAGFNAIKLENIESVA